MFNPTTFLSRLTFAQMQDCIEVLEEKRPGKPNTKQAGIARILKGMAAADYALDDLLRQAGNPDLADEVEAAYAEGAGEEIGRAALQAAAEDVTGCLTQNGAVMDEAQTMGVLRAMEAAITAAGPEADPTQVLAAAEAARLAAEEKIEAGPYAAECEAIAERAAEAIAAIEAIPEPAEETVDLETRLAANRAEREEREQAQAKLQAEGPKPGTGTRVIFDMMCRPEGCTRADLIGALGYQQNFNGAGRKLAMKYGYKFHEARNGRLVHYRLASA